MHNFNIPIREKRLQGKIAVVTGAGAGIGQGCARMFAAQGAKVFAVDLNCDALEGTVSGIREAGGEAIALACDLTDEQAVASMAAGIKADAGKVDILLNAAATAVFKWIEDMTLADWQLTLRAELDSVFIVTRSLWPLLKASGRASVINFGSANAWMALEGSPALAHCAGKGGVLAMTRQLAMEGSPHGIRANTIAPGLIVTDATRRHMEMDPGFEQEALKHSLVKRLGQPEDIAWCATWLGSDESGLVTGSDIRVDGGATAI